MSPHSSRQCSGPAPADSYRIPNCDIECAQCLESVTNQRVFLPVVSSNETQQGFHLHQPIRLLGKGAGRIRRRRNDSNPLVRLLLFSSRIVWRRATLGLNARPINLATSRAAELRNRRAGRKVLWQLGQLRSDSGDSRRQVLERLQIQNDRRIWWLGGWYPVAGRVPLARPSVWWVVLFSRLALWSGRFPGSSSRDVIALCSFQFWVSGVASRVRARSPSPGNGGLGWGTQERRTTDSSVS